MQPLRDTGLIRRIAFDTLGSTNAEALTRARGGERGPLWITATEQTAGRGRRGSNWSSPPGNLYASLLVSDAAPAARLPELCFVVALAVRDAIAAVGPQLAPRLKLKWPNDVLLGGAKITGILIEAETVEGITAAAIGIGINCAHYPDDTRYPATDLAAGGAKVTPDEMFDALASAMTTRLAQWDRGAGFPAIRSGWLDNAVGLGGDILVRLPKRELTGVFETLDEAGRLMLRHSSGELEAITAGDVFPALSAGAV
jgi:BirA family biotin operon repressor/biotin-[acetyl-CoA-carboxylase] ligase